MQKFIEFALPNQSKHCFFNQPAAKPKSTVTWITRVFPRFAPGTYFLRVLIGLLGYLLCRDWSEGITLVLVLR